MLTAEDRRWLAARSRPSPEVRQALLDRYARDELLDLAEGASAWNASLAAMRNPDVVLGWHRSLPPPPPELPCPAP